MHLKRYLPDVVAVVAVTLWGLVAWAWLDAVSSGLSPVGFVSAASYAPGVWLVTAAKGSHTSADLPWAALRSWLVYALAALLAVGAARALRGRASAGTGH